MKTVKIALSFACLACVAAAGAGGVRIQGDPTVTLALRAMPVSRALQELSAVTHVQFVATKQTANDIVCLRFVGVPLRDAMARLASAIDGTWKTSGDAFELMRTSDQLRAERAKEFAADVEEMRASIEKKAEAARKLGPWSESEADALASRVDGLMKSFKPNNPRGDWYKQASDLSRQAPIARMMPAILSALDPKELADLPPYYKTVWSTNPTSVQRPMPNAVTSILGELARDQAEWNAAIDRHQLSAPTYNGATYFIGNFGDFQNRSTGKVTTVLLSARRNGLRPELSLELAAYDEAGKLIGRAQDGIGDRFNGRENEKKVPPVAGEPAIVLDDDARAISNAFQTRGRGRPESLPEALRAKILQPEAYDPLSFTVSPALIQAAEIRKVNLVACLTDQCEYRGVLGAGPELSIGDLLDRIQYFGQSVEMKDGWLTVVPDRPSETRELRVDRKVLGRYLRTASEGKPMALADRAAFALSMPSPQENYLPSMMAGLLASQDEAYNDQEMLRLYGLLTEDQQRKMANGGLALGGLTEAQADLVNRMVYGTNARLNYNPAFDQLRRGFNRADFDLHNSGILSEPTEALPNGLPSNGMLTVRMNDAYVVEPSENNPMTARDLAFRKYMQDHPEKFPGVGQNMQKLDLSKLSYGQRVQMSFTFQFSSDLNLYKSLDDNRVDKSRKFALEDLPKDFQQQFNDAYEMMKKSYFNVKPGQFVPRYGVSNPPPAP